METLLTILILSILPLMGVSYLVGGIKNRKLKLEEKELQPTTQDPLTLHGIQFYYSLKRQNIRYRYYVIIPGILAVFSLLFTSLSFII